MRTNAHVHYLKQRRNNNWEYVSNNFFLDRRITLIDTNANANDRAPKQNIKIENMVKIKILQLD